MTSSTELYSERNGETEQTKPVQLKGTKFFPKQCVSAWLSISVGRTSENVSVLVSTIVEVLMWRLAPEETLPMLAECPSHSGGTTLPLWSKVNGGRGGKFGTEAAWIDRACGPC